MNNLDAVLLTMQVMFGDSLADPEQHPQQFKFQFNLAKWEMEHVNEIKE
jgi:hypothetical protein